MGKKEEIKDLDKVVSHWLETSNEDFETMKKLFESKTYHWSLFLGHISVEKILKAYYVKKHKNHPPFTHNLFRLAELSGLDIDVEYSDWLDEITSFNLAARYDDYKKEFYKTCNREFAMNWIEKITILREWIGRKL
jgi:HEPN domain-containing protein